ncbi:MAG: FAD-binding oxidoreductase [Candidatus Melainabacteria bacterium]|nr:FAD-binding oxidoreductase [Candidatus Melainabacteria bacterium]
MTRSIWLDQTDERPGRGESGRADVVIVGGGLLGACLAYHLSRRPGLSVILLESGVLAGASSGRNAGFVLRGIQTYYNECVRRFGRDRAQSIYSFVQESQSMLREFAEKEGIAVDARGSYLLAASIEELEELEESSQLMKEDGFEVEFLKDDPLDRDYYGALYNPCDFGINPVQLARRLLASASEQGRLTVLEGEHVLRVTRDGREGALTVHSVGGTYHCDRVLFATNAFSCLIDDWFEGKFHTVRGQILVTEPLEKEVVDRLCYANYGWVYFRQLPDRRLLLGGRRQLFLDEEVGYADIITPSVQAALEDYLRDYFPEVVGAAIDYRFSGVMAYTGDGLPLLGEHPELKGLFFALAFNGHGLGYAMKVASHLISVALDGAEPGLFDAARDQS